MSYVFDGPNKLIVISGTSFSAIDMYSRWKDWLQQSDNSKYVHALTSVAGDPIGSGQSIAPYVFLNTSDGWRIRPQESDHELLITGNLYSIEPSLGMFVPTLGDFTVTIVVERSSAAIAVTVGGIDQATVQAALTAQGYTVARAPKIDQLDAAVSSRIAAGEGLSPTQATMLLELYRIMGLDPTKPLCVKTNQRYVMNGGIDQSLTQNELDRSVVVQRQ